MSAATIIEQAKQDGVILVLSESGSVKVTGDQSAIARWLETIRENKPGIIATLRGADLPEPEPVTAENDYPEFDEEALHLAWVYHFAEQEPETAVFMCAVNHRQALAFHPCAIAAIPRTVADGVSCKTCLHCSRPGGWPAPALCGGRTDLPPAFGDNHPLRIQPEDGGTDCGTYKHYSEKWKK